MPQAFIFQVHREVATTPPPPLVSRVTKNSLVRRGWVAQTHPTPFLNDYSTQREAMTVFFRHIERKGWKNNVLRSYEEKVELKGCNNPLIR